LQQQQQQQRHHRHSNKYKKYTIQKSYPSKGTLISVIYFSNLQGGLIDLKLNWIQCLITIIKKIQWIKFSTMNFYYLHNLKIIFLKWVGWKFTDSVCQGFLSD